MKVQAAPNTHPGGVHGALFTDWYQSDEDPSPIRNPPIASAPKLMIRKITILVSIIITVRLLAY